MTITEATHALASSGRRERPAAAERPRGDGMLRLVDAIARVEPTWVEAVAVVQAVCGALEPGHAAPALDTLLIDAAGGVTFPPTDVADDTAAVTGAGRLLSGILRTGDCPMPVWEAMELARRSPARVGTARAYGASLRCFPAAQGPQELAQYYDAVRRMSPKSARPATASFTVAGIGARAGLAILCVALCGIGAGVGVGAIVATKTGPASSSATLMAALSGAR